MNGIELIKKLNRVVSAMRLKPDNIIIAIVADKAKIVITANGHEYPLITTTVEYVERMGIEAQARYFDHQLEKWGFKPNRLKILEEFVADSLTTEDAEGYTLYGQELAKRYNLHE